MNHVDPADLIAIERQARQMQAAYLAQGLRAMARAIVGLFSRPVSGRAA